MGIIQKQNKKIKMYKTIIAALFIVACLGETLTIIEKPITLTTNPTHYGDPSGGCMSDEIAAQIQGMSGDACFPPCTSSGGCPTDIPSGCTAAPQCVLQTSG